VKAVSALASVWADRQQQSQGLAPGSQQCELADAMPQAQHISRAQLQLGGAGLNICTTDKPQGQPGFDPRWARGYCATQRHHHGHLLHAHLHVKTPTTSSRGFKADMLKSNHAQADGSRISNLRDIGCQNLHGHLKIDTTAERCDARVENLPDVGSGVISRCSKLPNVDVVRLVGIGHRQDAGQDL
jgi:hypothetical protein